LVFRTVPSANTLVRWVDGIAFTPIVRARPCPTFGRPVRHRGSPLDYGPVLLRKPFRSRLAAGTLPSEAAQSSRSPITRIRLSPSCLSRVLHTPSSPWPVRHYPHLWIQHPPSGRRRDFNPSGQCAAQRTLRPPPPPCRRQAHFPVSLVIGPSPSDFSAFRRVGEGFPSSRRCLPHVPRPLRRGVPRGCSSRLFTPSMAFALTPQARLSLVV
jgi:hypothetical protein